MRIHEGILDNKACYRVSRKFLRKQLYLKKSRDYRKTTATVHSVIQVQLCYEGSRKTGSFYNYLVICERRERENKNDLWEC